MSYDNYGKLCPIAECEGVECRNERGCFDCLIYTIGLEAELDEDGLGRMKEVK